MTVYIEYVIIDNLIIDYLLLKATFMITGKAYKKGRLLLSAVLGAVVALTYPLSQNVIVLGTVVKILGGLLIMLVANTFKSTRDYYINVIIFFLLTFLTGGVIIGVFNIFSIDYSGNEILIATIFLPALIVISIVERAIKSIYKNRTVRAFTYKTDLIFDKKTVTVNGFLDTGNALFDGDSPVIVCEKKLFFNLIDNSIMKAGLKKISIYTVNGKTQNLSFKLDQVKIYDGQKVNIHNNVTIALVNYSVGNGYDVILNPQLLKGEGNESAEKIKKIS